MTGPSLWDRGKAIFSGLADDLDTNNGVPTARCPNPATIQRGGLGIVSTVGRQSDGAVGDLL